ncbi:hypothetical protein ANN_10411 [Periplaneta americana]|uniref:Uncharacterized protein n=1 Tax=Periplaneta americana TaxID=6978 RepID=A0ABQ8TSU0_PERAM|nr:hypothetical protein ANN_10411 [Periplaneta americana]
MRNSSYSEVRASIPTALLKEKWRVYEEVDLQSISENGSNRRADITVTDGSNGRGLILGSTIKIEKNIEQTVDVNEEKGCTYHQFIPHVFINQST